VLNLHVLFWKCENMLRREGITHVSRPMNRLQQLHKSGHRQFQNVFQTFQSDCPEIQVVQAVKWILLLMSIIHRRTVLCSVLSGVNTEQWTLPRHVILTNSPRYPRPHALVYKALCTGDNVRCKPFLRRRRRRCLRYSLFKETLRCDVVCDVLRDSVIDRPLSRRHRRHWTRGRGRVLRTNT